MATTALQTHTTDIVVPSIHLGSFSPYPAMSTDFKQSLRFPEESTVPIFREEKAPAYPQQRNPSQWRPNATSYPPSQPYAYNAYSTTRPSYGLTPTPPRTPPPAVGLYSAAISGQSPPLPVQPPNSPAQMPGPPREVCVECMMRDEDMADVDVTSPGVWDRESDVLYRELCQHEEEEDRDREQNLHPNTSSGVSSSASCSRPRARGARLTEGNLKVWLSLNPREPASRHQTLHAYLDTQNALLLAENKARLQAIQESRQLDDKMRDAYSELRRSANDLGASASALDDGGVKIRSPSASGLGVDTRYTHKRDTTLLENGMIVERVDMRKEEARIRKEERRARKASRDSLFVIDNRDRERDATSLYSFQAAEGSLRTPAPYDSTMSVSMPTSRSVRSMYTTPSSPWQQPVSNRPMSVAPSSVPGFASQTSLDSTGSPRRRFFGSKHWNGYFGSNTSLMQSGSMVDMHLGLDQERQFAQAPHVDISSNPPSLREAWPPIEDGITPHRHLSSEPGKKKKRRGFGRLWKIITGAPSKTHEHACVDCGPPREEEDEDLPLAPPPPLSYLVNRGNAQSERSMSMIAPGRHVSMPSLTSSNGLNHPRASSAPSGVGISLSSPSDQSSTLPSPTEVRFPYRDSSGDEPEDGTYNEEADATSKKKGGGLGVNPSRLLANMSEPDIRTTSPLPISIPLPPSMPQNGPSSSSLVPTIRVPPTRPMSVLSLDKNLPPLPSGEDEPPAASSPPDWSRSFAVPSATFPMAAYPHETHGGLSAPNPGFRSEDAARRQSFGGLASRPTLPRGAGLRASPGTPYDDFGVSRHSLAAFEPAPSGTGKRRSRFAIGALLGRKDKGEHRRDASAMTMPGPRSRELSFDAFAGHTGAPSVSISERSSASRRVLDELVPQDRDFIAYRYPSRDQRLDLSRS